MQNPRRFHMLAIGLCMSLIAPVIMVQPASSKDTSQLAFSVDREYCNTVLSKVDTIVRKHFYDKNLMERQWPPALKANEQKILASKNLAQLADRINVPIHALQSSHCQFMTPNDEIFYFLHDLFSSFTKQPVKLIDYTGAITGGVKCSPNQVRYVLDGSPAWVAGMVPGDQIRQVNGKPYVGQSNFWNTSGSMVQVDLVRKGKPLTVQVKPIKKDCYQAYVEAIRASIKITKLPKYSFGYVRLWSGGQRSHDAFEEALSDPKIQSTDGLIVDLRDGYGGNDFTDLDYFYRRPEGYPTFKLKSGRGERNEPLTYTKPLVLMINGGSRSGKELLAFSLKKTGRATLVGEKTAGAVLAGRLFNIDERCSLYLAILSGTIDGEVLEGKGVAPDVEVKTSCGRAGDEQQLSIAESKLLEMLNTH
jgi:carboxyl-terminal processing protease